MSFKLLSSGSGQSKAVGFVLHIMTFFSQKLIGLMKNTHGTLVCLLYISIFFFKALLIQLFILCDMFSNNIQLQQSIDATLSPTVYKYLANNVAHFSLTEFENVLRPILVPNDIFGDIKNWYQNIYFLAWLRQEYVFRQAIEAESSAYFEALSVH